VYYEYDHYKFLSSSRHHDTYFTNFTIICRPTYDTFLYVILYILADSDKRGLRWTMKSLKMDGITFFTLNLTNNVYRQKCHDNIYSTRMLYMKDGYRQRNVRQFLQSA